MLSGRQVATVIPFFQRWVARWPTVADLAAADIADVNAQWAGLGYYRRQGAAHRPRARGCTPGLGRGGWAGGLDSRASSLRDARTPLAECTRNGATVPALAEGTFPPGYAGFRVLVHRVRVRAVACRLWCQLRGPGPPYRARYLLEGAKYVVEKLGGSYPRTQAELLKIPGEIHTGCRPTRLQRLQSCLPSRSLLPRPPRGFSPGATPKPLVPCMTHVRWSSFIVFIVYCRFIIF
jgi:hypothetical protein